MLVSNYKQLLFMHTYKSMTVQIIEILGRSEQGMTKPYICRVDDGNIYFVKGIGSGRRSQVCEWIAGNLALHIGLPIAPFELVDVPLELVESNPDYGDLGYGLAFGSRKQMIMELNYQGISQVSNELQQAVLAFDWWIKNDDRNLTETGGNPNLFWEPEKEKLVVIDHNLAFDPNFSVDNFKQLHVFSRQFDYLFNDLSYRLKYERKFKMALTHWDEICAKLPREWYYFDADMTVSADFDLNAMLKTLQRCNTNSFWEMP